MNRLILFDSEREGESSFLIKDQEKIHHVITVLRFKEGDSIKVTLIDKGIGKALITELSPNKMKIQCSSFEAKKKSQISLFIGLSRPPTCKKIIEHATTLGCQGLHFFKASLSEKSYADSKVFMKENIENLVDLGLAQSGIYHQRPVVQTSIKMPTPRTSQTFFFSLRAKESFSTQEIDFQAPIHLYYGPERGWTEKEEEQLIQDGAIPIILSPSTLRVETAVFASMGQLNLLEMGPSLNVR